MLLHRRQRTRQPAGRVQLDLSNPLTRGLDFLASHGHVVRPGSIAPLVVGAGSPRISPSAIGVGPTFGGGAQRYNGGATPRYPATEGFTLEVLCRITAAPDLAGFVSVVAAYAGESRGIICFNSGNIVYWDGNTTINTGVPWRTNGSVQHVIMTSASGNGSPLLTYRDGVLIHTSGNLTSLVTPTNDPVFRVGDIGVGWNASPTGVIAKATYYRRGMTAREVAQLTARPWAIARKPPRKLWAGFSSAPAADRVAERAARAEKARAAAAP